MFHKYKVQKMSSKQAYEMMGKEDIVVVDVREDDEYRSGHILHALSIPLSTINKENNQLPDKNKTLLVYCRSGYRSQKAAKKFVRLGYKDVYDFGGILDWPYEIEES